MNVRLILVSALAAISLVYNVVQFRVAADLRDMAKVACEGHLIDASRCIDRRID